ncbi:TIGR02301 family protein [Agrobacterium rhizogenes]|uniref:TIGR02301 family protein n=1 Tax=Rhizobium rhizogenes TaxID=359 RepID=UPI0022B6455D|nr:TIGR02301 family protein [Rhizobium rhizogenes]MCZ7448766.1 TIGR02301 family protein [Rhizobium rhizogenes]
MIRPTIFLSLFLTMLAVSGQAGIAYAQPSKSVSTARPAETMPPKPAPYDDKLARLSEILGAVQYLRTLCPSSGPEDWRKSMSDLLAADTASEPERRQRMTAAFNRGYRSFAAIHTSCTRAAIMAEENYRNEGATLAQEIASRFGN